MITRNQIIHYTSDELIRVSIALTTGIVEKARQRHNLSPVASAALGRTMTGAALLAGDYKNHEGVSLKVAGDGPLGAVHADCFDTNKLRGYVDKSAGRPAAEGQWQARCGSRCRSARPVDGDAFHAGKDDLYEPGRFGVR